MLRDVRPTAFIVSDSYCYSCISTADTEAIPEHCPGTESTEAGKASACQGCPNQQICASAKPAPPDPALDVIKQRFECVKHKILVSLNADLTLPSNIRSIFLVS